MNINEHLPFQQHTGMFISQDRDYDIYGNKIMPLQQWRKNDLKNLPPQDGTIIEVCDDWIEVFIPVKYIPKRQSSIRTIHWSDRAHNPGAVRPYSYTTGWADYLTGFQCDAPVIWRYFIPNIIALHPFKYY